MDFKKEYRDLEMKVKRALREAINNSSYESKHISTKAVKVNVFNYIELVIVNDKLTFLDSDGLHYSLFIECYLEDLIDILDSIQG